MGQEVGQEIGQEIVPDDEDSGEEVEEQKGEIPELNIEKGSQLLV